MAAIVHVHGNSSGGGRGGLPAAAVVANHVLIAVVVVDLLVLLWLLWRRIGPNRQLVARRGWKVVVLLEVVVMVI
jgi:1-acyl-sn-glycerol-3-phosphate acyltransferase